MKLTPLALLLCLAVSASAVTQEYNLTWTLDNTGPLVSISSTLQPSTYVLTEYEYQGEILLDWSVPASALQSLHASQVDVYLHVQPQRADSYLWFIQEGQKTQTARATLTCRLENNACRPDSTLHAAIPVRFMAPRNAVLPREEGVTLTATLYPQPNPALAPTGTVQPQEEQPSPVVITSVQTANLDYTPPAADSTQTDAPSTPAASEEAWIFPPTTQEPTATAQPSTAAPEQAENTPSVAVETPTSPDEQTAVATVTPASPASGRFTMHDSAVTAGVIAAFLAASGLLALKWKPGRSPLLRDVVDEVAREHENTGTLLDKFKDEKK